jgi:adenylate cyclase class 2
LKSNPINEWLRIRDSRGKFSITYKNYKQYDEHGKSNFCDEYETKIENLDAFRKILHSLDFRLLTKVNKLRKIWNYKDYEISIDSVKNLGDFVEIEYKGNDDNPDTKRIVSEMVNFLKSAGCGKVEINHQGYPYLLMFPEKANYEAV